MKPLAFANLSTLVLTAAAVSTAQPVELSEGLLLGQIDNIIPSGCTDKTEPNRVPEQSS